MAVADYATTDGFADPRRSEVAVRPLQALLREANEQLYRLAVEFRLGDPISFVCECGRKGCVERVAIPAAAYDAVRRIPTHFILKHGHDTLADGRLAAQSNGYVVIEKWGAAGAFAVRSDPRRRSAGAAVGGR